MASVLELPKRRKLTWSRAMTKTKQAAEEVKSEWQMWARSGMICVTIIVGLLGTTFGFGYWLSGEFESMRTAAKADRDLMLRIAAATVQGAEERMMTTEASIADYKHKRDTARTLAEKREADAALDRWNAVRKALTKPYFPELDQQRANSSGVKERQ